MNDQHRPNLRSIQVIGAGFTGTLAAFLLAERGHRVTVIDASEHPGGLISTLPHPRGDIETAANGFIAHPLLERVADEIGVKLVPASKVARKNRFIWSVDPAKPGRQSWPLTVGESIGMAFRLLWNLATGRMAPRPLETLEAWGLRTIGRPATRKVLSTAVLGIYASPVSVLSASLVVGRFFKKSGSATTAVEKKARPKLRGTVAPERGMGEWFTKMRMHLDSRGVKFVTRHEPELEATPLPNPTETWICTSAPEAARLTRKVAPELSRQLSEIQLLPIVTASRFSDSSPQDPAGFGCLFHLEAGFNSLGVLWSSDIFPHRFARGTRAETWILKGDALSDDEILDRVQRDRSRLSGSGPTARDTPCEIKITRWPKAFPLYDIALERTLASLPRPPDGIVLCGNYLGRLGLSQIALQVQEKVEELPS